MGSFTDSVVRENDNSGAKVVHQKVPRKVQQKVQEKVQPKIHEKVQRYQGDSGNPSIILCQYFKFFTYMSNFVQGEQTQSQIFQTSRNDRNKFRITCFVKNC